jgi:hypothetical protein
MSGAILPLPQYVFMAWCLVKHRGNFTFFTYPGFQKKFARLKIPKLGGLALILT